MLSGEATGSFEKFELQRYVGIIARTIRQFWVTSSYYSRPIVHSTILH